MRTVWPGKISPFTNRRKRIHSEIRNGSKPMSESVFIGASSIYVALLLAANGIIRFICASLERPKYSVSSSPNGCLRSRVD